MKVLWNKFKRTNLSTRLVYITSFLIFLVSYIIFIINALRLEGIETTIRIIVLVVLGFILLLYGFIDLLLLLRKKRFTVYFSSLFVILISAGCIIGSMTINRILGSMDSLSKDTVIYTTNLIALNSTEFVNDGTFITGIIDNDTDVEGYILPYELINKEKLNLKIEKYSNYFEMLEDLYSGKINGMFVSSNYTITYSVYDGYANIKEDTKVLKEYSKEMKNQDYIENFASVTDPFTILVMGVDSTADTLKKASSFNGDTLMMISFNPHTLNATVFSIPRDTYVPIACIRSSSKINSSAAYGNKCIIDTVQNFTGIKIDYYVKVDFKGVVDLVNALGGIDVTVPENVDFCEQNSKRSFAPKDLQCIKSGYQHMDGEKALAFARHRKSYPTGDFQRVQMQQLVVEAMANRVKTITSVNDFYRVLDAVSNNIATNMSTKEMLNLYNVFKSTIADANDGQLVNIQKTYLTGYGLMMYVDNLGQNVYTFQYYEQSLAEIVKALKVNLELEKTSPIKTFSFSANKPYEVKLIGEKYYAQEQLETIKNFVGTSFEETKAWCEARNIQVIKNSVYPDSELYSTDYADGTIVTQSVAKGRLVKDVKSIIFSVQYANREVTTTSTTTTAKQDDNTTSTETTEKQTENTTESTKAPDETTE
jgi:LCP family protein required for cell wall assembly